MLIHVDMLQPARENRQAALFSAGSVSDAVSRTHRKSSRQSKGVMLTS